MFHGRPNFAPHAPVVNSQLFQYFLLTFGCTSSMTTHGWDNERFEFQSFRPLTTVLVIESIWAMPLLPIAMATSDPCDLLEVLTAI